MGEIASDGALETIFRQARSHGAWLDRPVSDTVLQALWELAKMGPTSMNCSPARILFLRTHEAKARLAPSLSPGNRDKTLAAPVTAIIAYDLEFYEKLPQLSHNPEARGRFVGNQPLIESTAFRNSTLQGGYLILAARALGLDCGPMSGFDNAALDREFFPDGKLKSNFLCNLGYGDAAKLHPRNPRLSFDEACQLL